MRSATAVSCFCGLLALAGGCMQNPYVLQRQVQALQQQQMTLAQKNQALETRAGLLDQDNQALSAMLAQSRQQAQLLEEQVAALQEQLGSSASQLARLREERQAVPGRPESHLASTRRPPGDRAGGTAPLETLPAISLPGVEVRRDGDLIRIKVPGDELFEPGGVQLRAEGERAIETIADELARLYPRQFIGIEGHTDNEPIRAGPWPNNHQFSIARATAVYEYLVARSRLRPQQLLIAGHGPNRPLVSNGTAAGRQANRRIELVVYPEQLSGR